MQRLIDRPLLLVVFHGVLFGADKNLSSVASDLALQLNNRGIRKIAITGFRETATVSPSMSDLLVQELSLGLVQRPGALQVIPQRSVNELLISMGRNGSPEPDKAMVGQFRSRLKAEAVVWGDIVSIGTQGVVIRIWIYEVQEGNIIGGVGEMLARSTKIDSMLRQQVGDRNRVRAAEMRDAILLRAPSGSQRQTFIMEKTGDPKVVVQFLATYFKNRGDVTIRQETTSDVLVSVKGMRAEIARTSNLWEKLELTVIFALNGDNTTKLYLLYGGYQAPGVGSNTPPDASYQPMKATEADMLRAYVEALAVNLREHLLRSPR